MENVLFGTERQDIDERIRAHGLDPCSFAYRWQESECVTHYVRIPGRVFGTYVPERALALYPKDREDLFITFEHDPRSGFRSSYRPAPERDIGVGAQTWQELMGLLGQWLECLTKDKASADRMVWPQAKSAPPGEKSLGPEDVHADDPQRAGETGPPPSHSPVRA